MRLFIAGLMVGLLFVACADRQDEAEKLAQEVTEQEIDTVTMSTETAPDSVSIADEQSAADAATTLAETEHIPEAPPGVGFTVQIAACPDYEYAQYLVDLYRKRGYEPYMTKFEVGGESFYRVRIGAYETVTEADAMKAEFLDKYSLDTWVDNKIK
jgi:cell division septation protein DedD